MLSVYPLCLNIWHSQQIKIYLRQGFVLWMPRSLLHWSLTLLTIFHTNVHMYTFVLFLLKLIRNYYKHDRISVSRANFGTVYRNTSDFCDWQILKYVWYLAIYCINFIIVIRLSCTVNSKIIVACIYYCDYVSFDTEA